jgi:SAM-dependent methyltransferase
MSQDRTARSFALDVKDREGIALLRDALRSAGYEPEHMRPMLHAEGDNLQPREADIPVVLRLLPEGDRLADLLRMFLLALEVHEAGAAAALAPLSLERALRLGVIERSGAAVRSMVRILPAADLLFACDRELEGDPDVPADHVMGLSSSSIFLASLTVRRPIRTALDVGCGGGIQSVLAAHHARRVIACDINPRALMFTSFNATLNGVANVECREGSFFGPVADEKFDLVVSNPPFVVSPDSAITFRDGGMRGDDVSRIVLHEAARHLADGGIAAVLVSWGVPGNDEWRAPLDAWVKGLGCDAWFLHHSRATPLGYAATWNEPLQRSDDAAAYPQALDRWARYYRELGYGSIGYGAVILRKRAAKTNWTRADDIHGQREPASAAQIERLIAAEDYLGSHDDAALLKERLLREPEHRLDQVLRAREGAFVVDGASLRLEEGLRFETAIDAFTAELFARLDGTRTLGDAATDAAKRFASDGLAPADVAAEAAAIARRLLALGFIRLNAE